MANFWTYAEYDSSLGRIDTGKTYLGRTSDVGSYEANVYGLYDMHGNVSEWCQDWYGFYARESMTDPIGPNAGSYRVTRGGSWRSDGRACRSAHRNYGDFSPHRLQGFRVVLSPGQ